MPEDETVDAIDEQIAFHSSSIVALKTRRNACMRINRLPPEMLTRIFSFRHVSDHLANDTGLKDLITFTHVCSHWRAVALSSPSLWASIGLIYPKWTRELFLRSKMAPLTIHATSIRSNYSDTLDLVVASMFRIRELYLVSDSTTLAQYKDHFTSAAPLLEIFDLASTRVHGVLNSVEDKFRLPGPAFGGEAPRLRHIKVWGLALDWDSLRFATIIQLRLHDVARDCRPSTPQLLGMLSSMPALEELMLLNVLPIVTGNPSEPLPFQNNALQLPRLLRIWFCGSRSECANLLLRVTFPSDASMKIDCTRTYDLDVERYSFESALRGHFLQRLVSRDDSVPAPFKWLDISSYYGTTTLMAWTSLALPRREAALSVSVPHPPGSTSSSLLDLCATLPLEDLQSVSATSENLVPREIWVQVLGQSAGIQSASINGGAAFGFVDALTAEIPSRMLGAVASATTGVEVGTSWDAELAAAVFLPALRELTLEQVDFQETNQGGAELPHIFHDVLLARLMERCVREVEIQSLTISDCIYVRDSYLDELAMVVVDVAFDGIHGDSEDEEDEDSENSAEFDYAGGWLSPIDDSDEDGYLEDDLW